MRLSRHARANLSEMPCTHCERILPADEFYLKPHKNGRAYRVSWCRDCVRINMRATHRRRGDLRKDYELRRNYGISLEDFRRLLASQGNRCAICSKLATKDTKRFHVDHCHSTGKIRGVLCSDCNMAIGILGDSLEGVLRAVRYLERAAVKVKHG